MKKLKKWQLAIGFLLSISLPLWAQVNSTTGASIEKVQLTTLDDDRVKLTFKTSAPVASPKSFSLDNPGRICLDFVGVRNGLPRDQWRTEYNVGNVKRVSVVEGSDKTRVVLDVNETVPFDVKANGKEVSVVLAGAIPPVQAAPVTLKKTAPAQMATYSHRVKNIDFRRGSQGEGRIIIDLSDAHVPIDFKEDANHIRLRFSGALLPAKLQHKLDVTDFGTPVVAINTVKMGDDVEMNIFFNGSTENIAYQADRQYTVEIRPLNQEQKALLKAKAFRYTGEKLSLNFQDIEVRAVLQLIADFTGLNIVASDSVNGNVTLRLQNVPWDQALDIILKTKGLAKRQEGNVLLIGPSEEIAAREKIEMQSNLQVQDLAPLRAEYIEVNYARATDIAALLKTEKNSLLSSRGTVSVDDRTNTLLVQDTQAKLEEVRALVHRLDIPIRQVLIESRIVFATDNFQDALGVSWGAAAKFRPGQEPVAGMAGSVLGTNGTGASTVALGADPSSVAVSDRVAVNLLPAITPLPDNVINSGFGLTIARLPGGTILDLELQALESEGLGKIVASPRLVTSNQQLAYIESGEEIPYLESTSSGAASVAFKKAVLRLEVTPQITPDDHIIMDLKVNQDSRGVVTNGVPAINTREMHTKVLVANGETVVLGGIYQQTKNSQKDQVPFFSKLPVVGWMFKSESNVDQRNELMIFVTPKIIQEGMA